MTGTGVGTIALDSSRAPIIVSGGLDADGKVQPYVVRYFLAGTFAAGSVTVTFVAGTWEDSSATRAWRARAASR